MDLIFIYWIILINPDFVSIYIINCLYYWSIWFLYSVLINIIELKDSISSIYYWNKYDYWWYTKYNEQALKKWFSYRDECLVKFKLIY